MNNQPMDRIEQIRRVRSLVEEAKRHPVGNPYRQKALTKAIRLLSPLLWKERSPHYQDALQQTLEYFCRHVDDYNPELGNVVTWLNAYLRWRLIDCFRPSRELPFSQFTRQAKDGDLPFAQIADPVDRTAVSVLNSVQEWAETDPREELRSLHMPKYPHVTAQFLILHRLPPETSWRTLSQQLGVNVPALSSFYQRHCITRLRAFGKAQGYLEAE